MNSGSRLLIVLCVLVTACFALTASANPQKGADPARIQWEHLAMPTGASLTHELSVNINRLGNEGWELVCVTGITNDGTTDQTIYYFKRPKQK